jgi:ribosomal protein L21
MRIIFDLKGKQASYFSTNKNRSIRIPYLKNSKIGDKVVIDKVLEKDGKFGQPYLPVKLIAKITNPLVVNERIVGMKYKPKKRYKKK